MAIGGKSDDAQNGSLPTLKDKIGMIPMESGSLVMDGGCFWESSSGRSGLLPRGDACLRRSAPAPSAHSAHAPLGFYSGNEQSRAHPAGGPHNVPHDPVNPRNPRVRKPCSRRKSPPIPAQPGSAMTGLSRRRSRVRVPSLPLTTALQMGNLCCLERRGRPEVRATVARTRTCALRRRTLQMREFWKSGCLRRRAQNGSSPSNSLRAAVPEFER